jgi:hypothetical protein
MNYAEITTTALGYADRTDTETVGKIDLFLRIVEARINQTLNTHDSQLKQNVTVVDAVTEYYDLPAAFQFVKAIDVCTPKGKTSLQYIPVDQLYARMADKMLGPYYTVTNDKLQLYYDFNGDNTEVVEIVYVAKVEPLTSTVTENWVSVSNPDVYIFGLLVEIYSFVKDAEGAQLWELRFKDSLESIKGTDWKNYWSGTSMQTRVA